MANFHLRDKSLSLKAVGLLSKMDPEFSNNVILTQTEFLTMNSRPKQPKYARNKNILVIGGSGSGKTRFFVKPNLMQMHSSYGGRQLHRFVVLRSSGGAGRRQLL